MFISVKNLIYSIDTAITYVEEAKEYHSCSEEEYNRYLDKMYRKLDIMIEKLRHISCNKTLISKYEKKVSDIKWVDLELVGYQMEQKFQLALIHIGKHLEDNIHYERVEEVVND